MLNIALLPLDNRPVSYLLPKQIAEFSGIDLVLPGRDFLGGLKSSSDLSYIDNWIINLDDINALVISLDNFIYGGLVQSRIHSIDLNILKKRASKILNLKDLNKYGFSSVMRIPNYNNDEEEKSYWKEYGEKIFQWSELTHKVGRNIKEEGSSYHDLLNKWYETSKTVPPDILADFKYHRDKNFALNLYWLDLLNEKEFNYFIFSCDDSSQYGINVVEAEYLSKQIRKQNLLSKAKVISGTDEIPLVLMLKVVLDQSKIKPSVSLIFNSESGKNEMAKYESNTVYSSVINQIDTLGLDLKEAEDSDIALFIHSSNSKQGDHIFKEEIEDTSENAKKLIDKILEIQKPFILIDLAYANGADPKLIKALMESEINFDLCYGYSAWNTCSNSTGSALSMGVNRWIAEKESRFKLEAFKKCLFTRFIDDYAYQSVIRHINITQAELESKMIPYVKEFSDILGIGNVDVKFKLPWNRSFEIEVIIK